MPIYYKVVKGSLSNLAKFEEDVANMLSNGYIPAGGVTVSETDIYQAVARNTDMGPRPQSIPTRPLGGGANPQSVPSSTPR